MRLLKIVLENYCQYRLAEFEFAPGLTAIVGRNGSGKTNLINGVYASITGDFGRNVGTKIDNICQLAPPTATARVRTIMEHAGTTLDITRGLRPVNTRLVIRADGMEDKVIG